MIDIAEALRRVSDFRVHPLGFFYLRMDRDAATSDRLHVWADQAVDAIANQTHTHSFDIHSRILAGRLSNEIFVFDEGPDGATLQFEIAYSSQGSSISATGRRGTMRPVASFVSTAGTSYALSAGVLHRAEILERPCVTNLTIIERGYPVFSYGTDTDEAPANRRTVTSSEGFTVERVLNGLR